MLTKKWDDLGWWSWGGLMGLKKEWMGGLAVRWHSILFVFSCIQTKPWVHITVSEENFVFHNPSCDLMIYHVSHLNSFLIVTIYFFFFKSFSGCVLWNSNGCYVLFCVPVPFLSKSSVFSDSILNPSPSQINYLALGLVWDGGGGREVFRLLSKSQSSFLGPCWAQLHGDHCLWWQCLACWLYC